jgi:Domain of unknown function (DUF4169)
MSVVNLNKARKAKTRQTDRTKADANAVKFGRSKADKALEAARAAKAARDLDGHRQE